MSLVQKIKDLLRTASLPTDKQTVGVSMGEPPTLAHTLTVEGLQAILRNAEAGDTERLFALYRDIRIGHAHCQTVLNQRKLAVLNKALAIVPEDPKSQDDVRAAEAARMLTRVPGWLAAMNHLLNGHIYPVAIIEQVYERAPANALGVLYRPQQWNVMPYHLLDYSDGTLKLWDADMATGQRLGTKACPQKIRHVVHRGHLLTDIPDNWGGPMRAALFWWLFAVMDRDWWIRFLDRFGAPFIVAKYDSADTTARKLLTAALSQATRLFGLVISSTTDVAIHAVNSSGHGQAYKVMQDFANAELSKLFLGQTMTVTAQAGGLGGGQAEVQDNTKGDIESWDLTALAATVDPHIIGTFLRLNGIPGRAVLQVATDTAKELAGKTALLEVAPKIGLELTDEAIDAISKASGLQFRRATAPAPGALNLTALAAALGTRADTSAILARLGQPTDDQLDQIARRGAPKLAEAFRGRYGAVPGLIAASTSAADLEHRLHVYFADLDAGKLQPVIEDALTAYAANGAATARQP